MNDFGGQIVWQRGTQVTDMKASANKIKLNFDSNNPTFRQIASWTPGDM